MQNPLSFHIHTYENFNPIWLLGELPWGSLCYFLICLSHYPKCCSVFVKYLPSPQKALVCKHFKLSYRNLNFQHPPTVFYPCEFNLEFAGKKECLSIIVIDILKVIKCLPTKKEVVQQKKKKVSSTLILALLTQSLSCDNYGNSRKEDFLDFFLLMQTASSY